MEALVQRLRAGDERAYEEMVRAHAGRMLAVARRMLRHEEDARDAVQEAFLRAFRGIQAFKGQAALGTWLHRIVVTSALMKLRTQKRRPAVSLEALLPEFLADGHRAVPEDAWTDPGDLDVERTETRAAVREAIDNLPDDYRTVILLRDVEQLDTHETAEALEISVPVVKTRLHRARQALRRLLEARYRAGGLG